jgi:hypothetical protein
MSEKLIQEALRDTLEAMSIFDGGDGTFSVFDKGDVYINDFTWLDAPNERAPYILIENAGEFDASLDTVSSSRIWNIPVTLIERFTDYPETLNGLRDHRQMILDELDKDPALRWVGRDGMERGGNVRRIRSNEPIEYLYDRSIPDNLASEATPIFASHRMTFEIEEF